MAHRLEIKQMTVGGIAGLFASFAWAKEGMKTQSLWWEGQDGGIKPRATFETRQRCSVMTQASGISDMTIATRPLYAMVGDAARESDMARELFRVDTDEALAVIGMRAEYCAKPGETIRALLEGMTGESDPYVQTAGILDNGGSVFAQANAARHIDLGRGSIAEVRPFVALNHNKRSDRLGAGVTDIVCANTLAVAWRESESMGVAFDKPGKRSSTYEARIKAYAKGFGAILEAMEKLGVAARKAKEIPLTQEKRKEAITSIIAADVKELTAQEENKISEVLTLTSGAGLLGVDSHAPGSAWSVVAGVTQWADRAMSRHYDETEKNNSTLRQGNTYLASALGLNDRANDLRAAAQEWLFETVGA